MITIIAVPGKDLLAPVVICDQCGERITDAIAANYEYLWHVERQVAMEAATLHKGCSRRYRANHPHYLEGGTMWMWKDLATWLRDLAQNAGIR